MLRVITFLFFVIKRNTQASHTTGILVRVDLENPPRALK